MCLTLLVRIQLMKNILMFFCLFVWTVIICLESNVDKQISVFPHLWSVRVSAARTCSKMSFPRWLKVTLKLKSTSSVFYMCITDLTLNI